MQLGRATPPPGYRWAIGAKRAREDSPSKRARIPQPVAAAQGGEETEEEVEGEVVEEEEVIEEEEEEEMVGEADGGNGSAGGGAGGGAAPCRVGMPWTANEDSCLRKLFKQSPPKGMGNPSSSGKSCIANRDYWYRLAASLGTGRTPMGVYMRRYTMRQ